MAYCWKDGSFDGNHFRKSEVILLVYHVLPLFYGLDSTGNTFLTGTTLINSFLDYIVFNKMFLAYEFLFASFNFLPAFEQIYILKILCPLLYLHIYRLFFLRDVI